MGGARVGGWVGGARVGGRVGGARVDGWRPGGWVGGWRPGGWVAPGWVGGWVAPGWLCRWVAPGWVGGWVAPGLDQVGLKPEGAQKHSFSAFWLFGPSWAEAQMCPKTFAFGIPVPKNIRIRHSGYSDQIGLKPDCAQKHSFSAFRLFGPNRAEAGMCPKTFVFGILAIRWVAPGWVGGWVAPGWLGGARVGGWVGGWRPGGWVGGWSPGGWVAPGWVGGWVAPGWLCRWVAPGWVGGWVAPGLDQTGLKPEGAQKHSFSAFWLFGPSWAKAQMSPKTFAFGIPVPKNIRIRHSCAQKHSYSAFLCPKTFVFGILAIRTKMG